MLEEGVTVINGTDINASVGSVGSVKSASRSPSPESRKSANGDEEKEKDKEKEKPKKFQNGWSKEQERLMAEWSDIASCYRWLHNQSEKIYHIKTLWINLPVIVLSTLGGTANFGIQSLFEGDENAKKYASFGIGGISLIAGLLTTVGNYLRYAQLEESHRVAAIAWGKFQRLIAVELALKPDDRIDSLDFLKICRADLDRLIEQSPPIPTEAITLFEKKIGNIRDLKKPDICGALEHTRVFESSETRLKQAAVEAALMLRRKKQTLSELVTPEIESRIAAQIQTRLNEAIETRKKTLEDEIEEKHREVERVNKEYKRTLEERKQKIKEEIELEKKLQQDHSSTPPQLSKTGSSQFESRLNYRKRSISHAKQELTEKALILHQKDLLLSPEEKNTIVIPAEIPKPEESGQSVIHITE
jgi:hypothetical protein